MERNLQLDWAGLVEEAIRRRESQNLTQKQLAVLAGVSGPTVNRFERRNGNITLKSALAILGMLGLVRKVESIPVEERRKTGRGQGNRI
ncbi:MAG TPA: helix-turn-helix transcriptional regulator [Phycisphaerae bacterium]